jgi:hypothetical protein
MIRTWVIVLVACGGSAPPASAPQNTPPPPPVAPAIEPEVIETKQPDPNDPALARQQAIEQAREAGILGTAPSPAPEGPLDKTTIRREIRAHLKPIQYCYEKQLLDRPTLTGTTLVQFLIATDGHVETSVGSGFDPKVDACVADAVKQIMFPKPDAGGTMQVNYPFTFRPAS